MHNIDAGQATGILLFVFTAVSGTREVQGDPNEGTLHWIPMDKLGEIDLVEDLPQILPRVLNLPEGAPPLFAHVSYDENDRIVIRFAD